LRILLLRIFGTGIVGKDPPDRSKTTLENLCSCTLRTVISSHTWCPLEGALLPLEFSFK